MCIYIHIHITYISYTYHIHITYISYTYHIHVIYMYYIYMYIYNYILYTCVCVCVISRWNCWLNTIVTILFTHSLQYHLRWPVKQAPGDPGFWHPRVRHKGRIGTWDCHRTRVREDFSWENPNGKIMGFHGISEWFITFYNGESLFNRYLMRYFMGWMIYR